MRLRYALYLIVLLSASCTTNSPPTSSNESPLSNDAEHTADQKSESVQRTNQTDAGIEVVSVTEQWARRAKLMDLYRADPGFAKWCILFHDIPDNPPYSFQQERLLQALPDHYYPCQGPSSETVLESKNSNMPTGIMVSGRGYLPGEKVTIRLSAKDAYREVAFFPRPLLVKKKTGELLATATLLCAEPGNTLYTLDICGIGTQEKYKFVSRSGEEVLSQSLEGPIQCSIAPEIAGQIKGIANVELQFEDGTVYSMELPWGYELLQYKLGNK